MVILRGLVLPLLPCVSLMSIGLMLSLLVHILCEVSKLIAQLQRLVLIKLST